MKVMAWLVGIVLAVLLVAAIAIPVLLPLETLVDELKHRVKRDTGYELAMQAPSVSVFPSLVIALEDISLAAPVAGAGPTMSIGQADLNIAWSSVWRGEIAVERFSLSDWVLDLRSPMATPA
ncbi:MAG: AsmA family, partial [Pseudomonadota bacterium]